MSRFLKKLKIEPPFDLAIPLPSIYLKETHNLKIPAPHLYCSTIYKSQDMKTIYLSGPSMNEWMKKM